MASSAASYTLTFDGRPLGFSLGRFEEPNTSSDAVRLFVNAVSEGRRARERGREGDGLNKCARRERQRERAGPHVVRRRLWDVMYGPRCRVAVCHDKRNRRNCHGATTRHGRAT